MSVLEAWHVMKWTWPSVELGWPSNELAVDWVWLDAE